MLQIRNKGGLNIFRNVLFGFLSDTFSYISEVIIQLE